MVGGSDVWGIYETHGEGGGVPLGNSVDTNGSLKISSTIGFKSTNGKKKTEKINHEKYLLKILKQGQMMSSR